MNSLLEHLPFRIGTTSYIIPDEIIPNVRFLADKVRDVELVLFDVPDFSNLPSQDQIMELKKIASASDLTYTVHLPLDLRFSADEKAADISINKAAQVIHLMQDLDPWAFILHLDAHSIPLDMNKPFKKIWIDQSIASLKKLADQVGWSVPLAVENLENYPPEWNDQVLQEIPYSHCIDIGHLWLQKLDPLPYLETHLENTRVIHLHGIGTRDHQSLKYMKRQEISLILKKLIEKYQGVVTLEIFSQPDLESSLKILLECLK